MQSKKRLVKFLNALILMCLEFHPNFVCFLIVEAEENFFVAFGPKGLCDLVLPPLKVFLCLGFVIIYHQIQVLHHEIAHEFNLHLDHPFIFHVFFNFVVTKTSSSPIVASFVHSVVPLSSLYTTYITHMGSSFYNHHSSCVHITCHDHDDLICCHLIH